MSESKSDIAKKHLQRGYQFQQAGHIEEAISFYQKSLDADPTAEAYTYMGWAHSCLGEFEKAIEFCFLAIELDSAYGNAFNDIGAYKITLGEYDEAEEYLWLALDTTKSYAFPHYAYYNLGFLNEKRGLWFDALEFYKMAMELEPGYTPTVTAYYHLQGLLN